MVTKTIPAKPKDTSLRLSIEKQTRLLDEYSKELPYLESLLEVTKEDEIYSRWDKYLNSEYQKKISLIEERVQFIKEDIPLVSKRIENSKESLKRLLNKD
jgi:archaellum component FlaC